MTIVIPMAGRGERFIAAGYSQPKMLIEVHGKTLLQWSVDSLPLNLCDHLIFIGLSEHEAAYGLSKRIHAWYGNRCRLDFCFLPEVTGGQAETVLRAEKLIDRKKPLLIFNIDTAFRSNSLAAALTFPSNDGVLGAFTCSEPRFSFATTDGQGWVTCVKEKEVISTHALTGLYHYRVAGDFLDVAGHVIRRGLRVKGEFYIAPLYNELIVRGRRFVINECNAHFILGTPDELKAFASVPRETVVASLLN